MSKKIQMRVVWIFLNAKIEWCIKKQSILFKISI